MSDWSSVKTESRMISIKETGILLRLFHKLKGSWAKAKGSAEFADKHGMDFGRLVIARKKDKLWQSADLNEMKTRAKARRMQSSSDLESLFV